MTVRSCAFHMTAAARAHGGSQSTERKVELSTDNGTNMRDQHSGIPVRKPCAAYHASCLSHCVCCIVASVCLNGLSADAAAEDGYVPC